MLKRIVLFILSCSIVPIFGWETFHGDTGLRGTARYSVGETPEVIWRLGTGAAISFPCIMGPRHIFAFTDQGSVIACDYRGRAIWRWKLPRDTFLKKNEIRKLANTGVLVDNGLAVAAEDGEIFLLEKTTGKVIWKQSPGIHVIAPLNRILAGGEELILVMDQMTGSIRALQTGTGKQAWKSRDKGRSDCPPAAHKGHIVFGSCMAELHVIDPENGKDLSDIKLKQDCQVAAGAALSDGHAVVGDRGGNLTAINPRTGETIWRTALDAGEIFSTPAMTAAHTAIGTEDKMLVVVNTRTGQLVWKKKLKLAPSSPAIAGNQVVTTDDGYIFFFELATGRLLWKRAISDALSPVSANRGIVVFGTDEGEIIALQGRQADD